MCSQRSANSPSGAIVPEHPNGPVSRDGRPALLVSLTDLFVSRADPDGGEIARYEELALHLLKDADSTTRAHMAARLATHRSAPISVIDALLQSDRVCATILLEHCPRLSGDTLTALAESGTVDEAVALARRRNLDPELARMLSERTDAAVHAALAQNADVALDHHILPRLLECARTSGPLAKILCGRIDDCDAVTPLFLHASEEQRAEILRNAEFASFTSAQISRVETANEVLIDWLVEKGKNGLWGLVAQEIVRLTGFERGVVDNLLGDQCVDGLAILLAAIGCPATKAIRLFLSCNPQISHSYQRVRALAHVVEHMPAHAAYRIVHAIIGTPMESGRSRYVPMSDPTAKPMPGRVRTGLSAHQMPAQRTQRANIRLQR